MPLQITISVSRLLISPRQRAERGDGNANFDEGSQPGNSDGNGVSQADRLQRRARSCSDHWEGGATGPNSNNDDFTNRSVTTGIGNVPPGGITTAAGTLVFANTCRNSGNANDPFALTVPTVPAGSPSRSALTAASLTPPCSRQWQRQLAAVAFGTSTNFLTRITAPAVLSVFTGLMSRSALLLRIHECC